MLCWLVFVADADVADADATVAAATDAAVADERTLLLWKEKRLLVAKKAYEYDERRLLSVNKEGL